MTDPERHGLNFDLSSDLLEQQFGPVDIDVLWQDDEQRLIRTRALSTNQVLELSYVTYDPLGVVEFPDVHQAVVSGQMMGKAFREQGIEFFREVEMAQHLGPPASFRREFNMAGLATMVALDVLVGEARTPYCHILETYSPAVEWPSHHGELRPEQLAKIQKFAHFIATSELEQ